MSAKIIPSLSVADIKVNIDYLVNALGFRLNYLAISGSQAILEYRGAVLVLKEGTANGPPAVPENFLEIQVSVEDIEEIYRWALTRGAIISRYLQKTCSNDGGGERSFTVSLPDGYSLMFVG
ncbi:MAG: VOC family protein [Sporomusaceae bacterium]|nr:VOC family protein [Sporomusaceae bacterium]